MTGAKGAQKPASGRKLARHLGVEVPWGLAIPRRPPPLARPAGPKPNAVGSVHRLVRCEATGLRIIWRRVDRPRLWIAV
ncbi:MAG: hypothetical protein QG597_4240 [Actinomycetota bacterium]|nr:hypothetical protein [Actinomycetota bacterium]